MTKKHSESCWNAGRGKAKLRRLHYWLRRGWTAHIKTLFSILSPPHCQSQAVVCISTPRKYPRSGYFLVILKILHKTKSLNKNLTFRISILGKIMAIELLTQERSLSFNQTKVAPPIKGTIKHGAPSGVINYRAPPSDNSIFILE